MIKSITLQASSCQRRRLKLSRDDGILFPETCGGTSKLPKEIVLSNFSLSDNKNSEVCRCITCMIVVQMFSISDNQRFRFATDQSDVQVAA